MTDVFCTVWCMCKGAPQYICLNLALGPDMVVGPFFTTQPNPIHQHSNIHDLTQPINKQTLVTPQHPNK